MGNAVGSPLPLKRYGPVTTEPQGEASITATKRAPNSRRGKSRIEAIRGPSTKD
jgi:hypothetical protein